MSRPVNPAVRQGTAEALGVDPLVPGRGWVLTGIISHLAQHPGHRPVLKGGQALRHIHGGGRPSKDVDQVSSRRLDCAEPRQH